MHLYSDKSAIALFFQRFGRKGDIAKCLVKGRGVTPGGLPGGWQGQDSYFEVAVAAAQLNQVSGLNCAGRFGLRAVDQDSPGLAQRLRDAAARGQTARLEEQV